MGTHIGESLISFGTLTGESMFAITVEHLPAESVKMREAEVAEADRQNLNSYDSHAENVFKIFKACHLKIP